MLFSNKANATQQQRQSWIFCHANTVATRLHRPSTLKTVRAVTRAYAVHGGTQVVFTSNRPFIFHLYGPRPEHHKVAAVFLSSKGHLNLSSTKASSRRHHDLSIALRPAYYQVKPETLREE